MAAWCSSAAGRRAATSWPSSGFAGLRPVNFKGRYRTVRHKDHAVPAAPLPRPLLGQSSCLDIRAWRLASSEGPLLLVTSPKKCGGAVQRNRFRRRVRMAFLALAGPLKATPWVVWVRPGRQSPPVGALSLHDIEGQLLLALRRLPPQDAP